MIIFGHHHPSNSPNTDLTYVLHVADCIAGMSGSGYDDHDFLYHIEEGALDHLSLKPEEFSAIVLKISESADKIFSN